MMMRPAQETAVSVAAKNAIPVGYVTATKILSIPVDTWVGWFTLLVLVLTVTGWIIDRVVKPIKRKRNSRRRMSDYEN